MQRCVTAQRVSDRDDPLGVDAMLVSIGSQKIRRRADILDHMFEAIIALRAPGAAIVKEHDIVAGATDGLGEIEVLFIAGIAVQHQDGWVRAWAAGDVDQSVQARALAFE